MLGVQSQLEPPACTTTTASLWDPSLVCNLHHSLQQCWILNSLSEARDQTQDLMDTSRLHYCWAITGTPIEIAFYSHPSNPFPTLAFAQSPPATLRIPMKLPSLTFKPLLDSSLTLSSYCFPVPAASWVSWLSAVMISWAATLYFFPFA